MFSDNNLKQVDLWRSGDGDYHTYRIPALTVTNKGTVLAFCEGRKHAGSDTGDIAMLLKRSEDNGITWSEQAMIWDDEGHTCGNPAPVVDHTTGEIFLLMTWNRGDDHERDIKASTSKDTRRVFVTSSTDDGHTWSEPQEITDDVKQANWTWYATGPGHGIQIKQGQYANRLVIPCDHIEADTNAMYSHVIYSDDHGKSWQLGGRSPEQYTNESEVVELSDGTLLLSMRSYLPDKKMRQATFSHDGGATWHDQRVDETLIEPICQASICDYPVDGKHTGVLLFANPASEQRVNMTVRGSRDNGQSWPYQMTLYKGSSAYSDLAVLPNGKVACLYECGDERPYDYIRLALFDVDGED